MERIVLLTEHDPDLQTRRCIEQLRSGLARDFELVSHTIATGSWTRLLGRYSALRSATRGARLVHAWGYRALRLATVAAECPILYTPLPDDPPKAVTWARSAMARRQLRVLSLSAGEDRFAITAGIPEAACLQVRPGVRMARPPGRDASLRHELGFADDHIVVLAVGESLSHANHTMALHAVTTLHFMDRRFGLLLWGKGPEIGAVRRLQRAWSIEHIANACEILGSQGEYESILPAADIALVTAPDRVSLTPVLACMAAGIPLVAPATYAISQVLEDRHTALLYREARPRPAAQRLLAMWEDEPLRQRLADRARAEAYEMFPVSEFVAAIRSAYLSTGTPTQTAPAPVSGGAPQP